MPRLLTTKLNRFWSSHSHFTPTYPTSLTPFLPLESFKQRIQYLDQTVAIHLPTKWSTSWHAILIFVSMFIVVPLAFAGILSGKTTCKDVFGHDAACVNTPNDGNFKIGFIAFGIHFVLFFIAAIVHHLIERSNRKAVEEYMVKALDQLNAIDHGNGLHWSSQRDVKIRVTRTTNANGGSSTSTSRTYQYYVHLDTLNVPVQSVVGMYPPPPPAAKYSMGARGATGVYRSY